MSAGVIDVLELIEVDEEQRTRMLMYTDVGELDVPLFDKSAAVEQSCQVVMVRQFDEHGVAFAQCRRRRLERFDDI